MAALLIPPSPSARHRRAYARGAAAEAMVGQRLEAEGWTLLGRRLRTAAGEVDLAAQKDGLLALIEVKARRSLATAATALSPRQRSRLTGACAILLAENPAWGPAGVRFDLVLVDAAGRMRRIADAFHADAAVD